MSENMQPVDEDRVLSSLYGMTLAGLHEMQKKRSNEPIKHLIARASELKESQSNGGTARGSIKKRPSRMGR